MAASNRRVHEQDTVHHITSRIAHRVYFLGDDERNDLVGIVRRAAEFTGIRLLAWCIMTNHFHLMVHLPVAVAVGESEVLRRYGVLKGQAAAACMAAQIDRWRQMGEDGGSLAAKWLDEQRRRMYDVGEFMKIVKQWFTEEYNRRNSHVGTLWESEYHDRPVGMTVSEMARRMGYVHLNPIRAAAAATYDDYRWSSFSSFSQWDPTAVAGMRFVYDDEESSVDELKARHVVLLDELLEAEKRKRAEEIARKRAAGYEVPADHLTTEATIAQAAAHLEAMRKSVEEHRVVSASLSALTRSERKQKMRESVVACLQLHPDCSIEMLASTIGTTEATAYWYLRSLQHDGLIERSGRGAAWTVRCRAAQS